jgi:phosphoglycolate phosphatase-like HAD superfamily hydrolase
MRVILFDIDGTLIRTGGAGIRAFARTAELVFGLPGGTDHLCFHGRTDTSLVREFLQYHGLEDGPQNMGRFLETYLLLLGEMLTEHPGERCPGVGEFIAACRQIEPRPLIGLLTGNVRRGAELKLRAHGLWDEFAVGGFGDDHEDRGQIAAIARRRSEESLGATVDAADVVVVGDTERDVACARAIGARCLAVATGSISAVDLARVEPDWLVSGLDEIHPEQLRSGDPTTR